MAVMAGVEILDRKCWHDDGGGWQNRGEVNVRASVKVEKLIWWGEGLNGEWQVGKLGSWRNQKGCNGG